MHVDFRLSPLSLRHIINEIFFTNRKKSDTPPPNNETDKQTDKETIKSNKRPAPIK